MLEMNKGSQGDSPLSRAGGGDISERELSRERYTLQYTPPNRVQPAHPKKQLLSAPVNKFTASRRGPAASLQRIKTCLDECRLQSTPPRRPIGPKAVSMEDLTPGKKIKMDSTSDQLETVRSPLGSSVERAAAARIGRFMLAAAWRRRRREVQCLKKTLECQVSGSERLRRQVHTLRALLDSDCGKLRRALHELQRLKQLLAEKEAERMLLQREKLALEGDVCAAEDRASEMSIGWHNCRNELELARAAAAGGERALAQERAAAAEARQQRDHAYARLSLLEGALSQHEALLAAAEAEAAELRREADERQTALEDRGERLKAEIEARERSSRECALLNLRMSTAVDETRALKSLLLQLQGELARLGAELDATRERLDWWPKPLVRMLGAARSWLYNPKSIPEAVVWSLVPARHGC